MRRVALVVASILVSIPASATDSRDAFFLTCRMTQCQPTPEGIDPSCAGPANIVRTYEVNPLNETLDGHPAEFTDKEIVATIVSDVAGKTLREFILINRHSGEITYAIVDVLISSGTCEKSKKLF